MGKAIAEKPLDVIERRELRQAEAAIEAGQQTFIEVGTALMGIRDGKLYREQHKTFEAYCKERWGIERNYANKLIAGTQVVNKMVDEMGTVVPISNEAQARELGKVPEEQRGGVLERATEAAGGQPTARHIKEAAEQAPEPEAPDPPRKAEKAKVVDGKKRPVPADLIPVFEAASEFKSLIRELTGLQKQAEALAAGPAGAFLKYGQVRTALEDAKHALKFGAPYVVCTYCRGTGNNCKPCRGAGYLNQTPTTRNHEE